MEWRKRVYFSLHPRRCSDACYPRAWSARREAVDRQFLRVWSLFWPGLGGSTQRINREAGRSSGRNSLIPLTGVSFHQIFPLFSYQSPIVRWHDTRPRRHWTKNPICINLIHFPTSGSKAASGGSRSFSRICCHFLLDWELLIIFNMQAQVWH